jgi:hypothetical protein
MHDRLRLAKAIDDAVGQFGSGLTVGRSKENSSKKSTACTLQQPVSATPVPHVPIQYKEIAWLS